MKLISTKSVITADGAQAFIEEGISRNEQQSNVKDHPALKIDLFLEQRKYSFSAHEVIAEYSRYKETGCYLSDDMKDCIDHLENEIRQLL